MFLTLRVCACVCVCTTYTYANDIGQCHCVTNDSEIVMTEDNLESLQNWRVVLRQGRMLGKSHTHKYTHTNTHTQSQKHEADVKVKCNANVTFKAAEPAGPALPP